MPTISGTSVKGRNLMVNGLTAATTARLKFISPYAAVYRRFGYFTHEQVESGVVYQLPNTGIEVWYGGAILSIPSIGSPNSRNIVMYWAITGVAWQLSY